MQLKKGRPWKWAALAAAAAIAALALLSLAAQPAPAKTDAAGAVHRGLSFLSQVNVTADTLSAREMAIPPEGIYGNLSELALYRKTDFMLDLNFIGKEVADPGPLEGRASEAAEFLQGLARTWQDGGVDYRYYDPGGEAGEYAYDLYCMVALETGNADMARKIRGQLKQRGWSSPQAQHFRVIIDESWCIMLLAANGENASTLDVLLEQKKLQQEYYDAEPAAGDPEIEKMRRSYAATHVLMVLTYLEDRGYDVSAHAEYVGKLQERAYSDADANKDSPDYLSNSVYFLAKSGFPKGRLAPLADALVRLQKPDGGWKSKLSPESFRGLLTARAVLALNAYMGAE
ncbi:MAG: hypothetical protein V1787_00315 [Candidatus Micrarchaeota archaeon]